jgi:hypothetical protein
MRTFLVLICSLALAWVTLGEEQGKKKEYMPGTRAGKPPAVGQPTTVHQPAKQGVLPTGKPPAVGQPTTVHQPANPGIAPAAATPAAGGGHGLVWVNTATHVYHTEGSRFYGTTKKGKYVSEADAIKEGDRAAAKEQ